MRVRLKRLKSILKRTLGTKSAHTDMIGIKNILALLEASDLPPEITYYLSFLRPVLVNRYSRKYWLSRDKRYRLTMDHKLWFGSFVAFDNTSLRCAREENDVIVEIKYHPDNDHSFSEIANGFEFRQTRSSKYVAGIDHIYGIGAYD